MESNFEGVGRTTKLNTGATMPTLGFGVYQIPPGTTTKKAVQNALEVGYRLIDTASYYRNEKDVGSAIRGSGIPRSEIFVTTKLFPTRCWDVEKAFYKSLNRLGLDYVDLYLIHFPFFNKKNVWKTLEKIHARGHARAIGVNNYSIKNIETILESSSIVPAVNQVEFHPFLFRKKLLEYCAQKGIVLEAHSPLTHGKMLTDSQLRKIAAHYNKSTAQLLIRWALQHGLVVIPKTRSRERMQENFDVFDFTINDADMQQLDTSGHSSYVSGLSRLTGDPV